jgi:hypothetical protein
MKITPEGKSVKAAKKKKLPPFYLNPTKSNDTEVVIMLRLYDSQFKSNRFTYSTGEKIAPKYWDAVNGQTRKPYDYINSRLTEILTDARKFILMNRKILTRELLAAHLDGLRPQEIVEERPKTLLEEYQDYLDITRGSVIARTMKVYQNSFNVFKSFLESRKATKILAANFDKKHFELYRSFLKQRYPNSENTISKTLKQFKMALNSGIKLGMDHNEITFRETATAYKLHLTQAQLEALKKLRLEGRLDRIRDLMLVHAHVGVRVSDLFRLPENIQGDRFVIQAQQKTKKPLQIPILPIVRDILNKYNGRIPRMSDVKYNLGLKLVMKKLDEKTMVQVREADKYVNTPVWKLYSSHDMIRTFVTIAADKGIPVSSIAQLTGKTVAIIEKNYLSTQQDTAEKHLLERWS